MSSINSQTDPFPQNNGLTYFVNNVRNLKRFHFLIPNYADEVSIQHFFYIALFQNLLQHEVFDTTYNLLRSMLGNTLI